MLRRSEIATSEPIEKIRLTTDQLAERLAHLRATHKIPAYHFWQGETHGGFRPGPDYQWNCAGISFDVKHSDRAAEVPQYIGSRIDVWVSLSEAFHLGPAFDDVLLRAALAAAAHHTLRAYRQWRGPRDAIAKARGNELDVPDPRVLLLQTTRGLDVTYLAPTNSSLVLAHFLLPEPLDDTNIFAQIIARAPQP
jgi:hypothetical protein